MDGYMKIRGPSVSVTLTIPAVPEGAAESRVLYQMWPAPLEAYTANSETGVASGFLPDIPLVNGTDLGTSEAPESTVVRSSILPGRARPPVSGRVWCLCLEDRDDGYSWLSRFRYILVLGQSSRVSGAFERLGLINTRNTRSADVRSFWHNVQDVAEFTIV